MSAIDDSRAGEHQSAFRGAAEQFCERHQSEQFVISSSGFREQGFLVNIHRNDDRHAGWPLVVTPAEDMEESILAALEQWWNDLPEG